MSEKLNKPGWKLLVLFAVGIVGIVAAFLIPRIAQDPTYHNFADTREILGIPNFWNVLTSLPFLFVGAIGLTACIPKVAPGGFQELRAGYITFFAGVFLTGLGSSYYHYVPSNPTLVWDRLPITISFMAFFSVVIGESISLTCGRRLLFPLLVFGAASVVYWHLTEVGGVGDLRPYGLVQFLPMVLMPLILGLYGSTFSSVGYLWAILATYYLAKLAEHWDVELFNLIGVLSGHSMKHLFSGLAAFWLFVALKKRRERGQEGQACIDE